MNTQTFRNTCKLLVVALFALVSLIATNFAFAQSSAGVGISPAIIDPAEKFEPGQVGKFFVKVSNLSTVDQTYFLSTRDIVGVRDAGVPIFAENDSPKTGFELSEWIEVQKEVFIVAGQQVEVPITITVPETVSPGSHFGSVVISVDPPKLRSSGAGIGYEVANIINIRIAGEVDEVATIRQFSTSQYIYGKTDVEFSARIENGGNTLIKPTGPLEVVNMFGKRVAMLNFNEAQAGIFPKTLQSDGLRDYQITWTDESPGFGRYEALLSVVYGSTGKMSTISSTVTFWILPMNIITPALIALGVLFLIIFVSVKLYVRRTMAIATSGTTRRLVRSRKQNQFPVLLVVISMLALSVLFFIILLLLFA